MASDISPQPPPDTTDAGDQAEPLGGLADLLERRVHLRRELDDLNARAEELAQEIAKHVAPADERR
jgi:hypothetical protein